MERVKDEVVCMIGAVYIEDSIQDAFAQVAGATAEEGIL